MTARSLTPLRFVATAAAFACVALIVLVCLPQDPYARFAAAASESPHYLRLRWIYERVHFDRTPIDVAFIGTSHTQSAIDSRAVEAALHRRGFDLHVVNFAIPHLGRDLHYLITRELLESREVRELVVEVQDFEPRAPHPAFQRLATVGDLLNAPVVINSGLFENIVRLPRRELDLFVPEMAGKRQPSFERAVYEGPHWDDTERLHGFTMPRTGTHPAGYLSDRADELRKTLVEKESLARAWAMPDGCSLLKRYNRVYLQRLLALAREKHVHVTFLYLPFFEGPARPVEASFYDAYGPTLTPRAVLDDPSSWLNVDHFNVFGSRKASAWVGETLRPATGPTADTPLPSAPCF